MILVTGSTGYIGFHICEMLELKKIPYFGIDNFSRSLSKNIINKKKFLKIDINSNDIPSLLKSKKVHTVIHAAAFSFPPESEDNKEIYYKNNILKTKKFIDNCSKGKIKRFIFLSSSNVYNFSLKCQCLSSLVETISTTITLISMMPPSGWHHRDLEHKNSMSTRCSRILPDVLYSPTAWITAK